MKRLLLLGTVALGLVGAVSWPQHAIAQAVRYVDNIRSCDGLTPCYPTIMDAVDAAAAGESIEVFPGVYHEEVVVVAKPGLRLQAHDEFLPPVIAAPARDAVAITRSAGVQVLRFILEAPTAAGVAVSPHGSPNTVVQGNLITAVSGLTLHADGACAVRNNSILGGGITLFGGNHCAIEGNAVDDAGIALGGDPSGVKDTMIGQNLVRVGGIVLSGKNLKGNIVDGNFVSSSPGDGILVDATNGGPGNRVEHNTAIDSASGCDINDTSPGRSRNTWANNRFATSCGAAGE